MLSRLVPMFLVVVAMAPWVAMVNGQVPTDEELQAAVAQATVDMASQLAPMGTARARGGAKVNTGVASAMANGEQVYTGAMRAMATVHRSTEMSIKLSERAVVLENIAGQFMSSSSRRTYTLTALSSISSNHITGVCDVTSMETVTCPSPAGPEFRSADGRCNNRNHPLWGSTEQPFKRLLPPAYRDDFKAPRTTNRSGAALPSARLVSSTMHEDLRKSSPKNTHMVMAFGQFLDHDITLTPNFMEEGVVCTCGAQDDRCFNIPVPPNDPDFGARPCLEFTRSRPCPNEGCRLGPRQQINQITAFVDASNVYGSSEEDMEALRKTSGQSGTWLQRNPAWAVDSVGTPWVNNGQTYDAGKAFDGNAQTYWNPQQLRRYLNNWYIVLDLGRRFTLTRIAINSYGDTTHDVKAFKLQTSQGGSPYNWRDVVAKSNVQGGTARRQVFGGFQRTARYWRFIITRTHSGYQPWMKELNLFGTPARGLLKSRPNPADSNKRELLPEAERHEFECPIFNGPETCSEAGDVRVNEQPGLTSMHTVFMREHNRIARRLSALNPSWDDDQVFYETRKIVGALMQKILYGEDLPHVLGPAAMARFGLTLTQSGFYSGYDASVNPTIANAFATAAYRFGHTLVQALLRRANPDFSRGSQCPIQLALGFFNPSHIFNNDEGGPDSILRGLTDQPHEDYDRFMVSGLTNHLFADPPESDQGFDLAAFNIQRGRDHGLPGYNDWRERCGLPRANSFDELAFEIPDCFTRQRLENLYNHVDDIDLFTGGIAEAAVEGGIVGPTFACLNGLQFRDLRQGDRFWFENPGQFTAAQLAEIKKSSLARILCDNTDGTTHMQPDVFLQPGDGNERVACDQLPQMDLSQWQE